MSNILIGGSQRSGTTLMQSLLCCSPDVGPLVREATYLRMLLMAMKLCSREFWDDTRHYFDSHLGFAKFHTEVVQRFIKHAQQKHGSTSLVFKEPHLTFYFNEALQCMPQARAIVMVRDPRGIVNSLLKVHQQVGRTTDVERIAAHVLSFYAVPLPPQRSRWVKYEDLLRSPATELKSVCQWLQIRPPEQPTPSMGNLTMDDFTGRYAGWYRLADNQGLHAERIDAWKQELPAPAQQIVVGCCGQMMKNFGYDSDDPTIPS